MWAYDKDYIKMKRKLWRTHRVCLKIKYNLVI